MFRIVLAIYVLMLSLMGPSPCCCSIGRAARTVLSTFDLTGNRDAEWSPCCKAERNQTLHEDSSNHSPVYSDSDYSGDCCECKQSVCSALPKPPVDHTVELPRSWSDHLTLGVSSPVLFAYVQSARALLLPDTVLYATSSGREIRISLCSWVC